MGDLRNKINKIERAKADKAAMESFLRAAGWRPKPPGPLPSKCYPKCACGLTVYEATVYQCGQDGCFCLACMPPKWKQDFIGHLAAVPMPYNPGDHGEKP